MNFSCLTLDHHNQALFYEERREHFTVGRHLHTLDVEVDVIASLSSVLVLDVTDVASAVGFVSPADE